jgi:hypothetical protein
MKAVLRALLVGALGLLLGAGTALAQKGKPDRYRPDEDGGSGDWKMTEEWGYERPEKTIRDFITGDLDECKRQCLREPACRAYVYKTGSGSCRLKYEATSKKPDKKSVTGVKVRRGGSDDRDDFGNWAEAKKACRERVARETSASQGSIKLDFDEDTGNTARFHWHAAQRRGNCTATENGRVTDFNTLGGSTKDKVAATPYDRPATPDATDSKSKSKDKSKQKSKDKQTSQPATDATEATKQTK